MENDINSKGLDLSILKTVSEILGKHGKTDEEIKSELLRDFTLTEEAVDGMLAAQ